jgi:Skp family chaperone for outer membrane proteins
MRKWIAATIVTLAATGGFAADTKKAGADEDFAEMAVSIAEKLFQIVADNKDDCKKMATNLDAFITANKDKLETMKKKGDQLTPEQREEMKKKYGARQQAALEKAKPGLIKCGDTPEFKAAMEKMPKAGGK